MSESRRIVVRQRLIDGVVHGPDAREARRLDDCDTFAIGLPAAALLEAILVAGVELLLDHLELLLIGHFGRVGSEGRQAH